MGDQEQAAEPKKTKITYEQYMRYSQLIVGILKEFEQEGQESVSQSDIVN